MRSLYNAGLWVRFAGAGGCTLLADALEGGYPPYAGADTSVVMALEADALLFTHKHPDHFDARMCMAYLSRYPACRVFALAEVITALRALGVEAARLCQLIPFTPAALSPGVTLTALPTRHMGAEYRHKEHASLLLAGDCRLLLAGDAAPIYNNFEPGGVPLGHVDVLAAPYPYVLYEPAQRMFTRALWTDVLVANHIPEPDSEGFREKLRALPRAGRTYRVAVTEQNQMVEGFTE